MKHSISKLILFFAIVPLFSCTKKNGIDTSNPVISIVTPNQNDTLTSKEVAIQFKVTDNESLSTETLSILDENNKTLFSETKSIFGTSYSYSNSIEIGGTNQTKKLTIKIVCSDNASNTETSTTQFWVKI